MGKTAENERIKLRATYNNNIAVALYVGGFLLPYFAIMQKSTQISDFITRAIEAHKISIAREDFGYVLGVIVTLWAARYFAKRRRKTADELLKQLVD